MGMDEEELEQLSAIEKPCQETEEGLWSGKCKELYPHVFRTGVWNEDPVTEG